MTDRDFEPEIFDKNETTYPVSTRSWKQFYDLYPLSIRQIAREHLEDTQQKQVHMEGGQKK